MTSSGGEAFINPALLSTRVYSYRPPIDYYLKKTRILGILISIAAEGIDVVLGEG
jgi:hypothetical protein